MAAKIPKRDRLKYFRRETPEVCTECDPEDQCGESTHRKKVVERWICELCSKKHISRAGVIRHMQDEHERKPKPHVESAPRIPCNCGKDFLTMHQYYEHHISEHGPRVKGGQKRRETNEGQEPDQKRAKKHGGTKAEFEDLLAKIKAQLQSKD